MKAFDAPVTPNEPLQLHRGAVEWAVTEQKGVDVRARVAASPGVDDIGGLDAVVV